MKSWFKPALDLIHTVGVARSVGGLIALALEAGVTEIVTNSIRLRVCLGLGAAFGGVWGFRRTIFKYKGKGRPKCVRTGGVYLALWVFSILFLVVGPVVLLNPAFAEMHQFTIRAREYLLRAMPWSNVFEFVAAFAAAYFLVGSIILTSPKLANPRD